MGFDMYMVRKPTSLPEGYKAQYSDMPDYHRNRVGAMPVTLCAMEWADCLRYATMPEMPDFPPPGFEDEERAGDILAWIDEPDEIEIDPPATEAEIAACRAYHEAVEAILTTSSLEDGRVASYKWDSNDGWLVTPEECAVIAEKIREHAEMIARDMFTDAGFSVEDGLEWLDTWAWFNAVAAEHGGYRVR